METPAVLAAAHPVPSCAGPRGYFAKAMAEMFAASAQAANGNLDDSARALSTGSADEVKAAAEIRAATDS